MSRDDVFPIQNKP